MATTGQVLHDQAVLHRVGLGRYSTSVVHRVIALLNRVDAHVVARIAEANPESRSETELNLLLETVRAMQAKGWLTIQARLDTDLGDLSGAELSFQSRLLGGVIGAEASVQLQTQALTVSQVVAAAKARPFQGKLLREWLTDAEDAAARRTREVIRQGFVEGQTIDQMVRILRGTRANRYQDGVLEISRRGAEAMVRTAITHTASVAAQESYHAVNAGRAEPIIVGVEWVSTLDSRTSLICASRDGNVYPLDSGPRPPAHINCRSTTIPRLAGMAPFERATFEAWIKTQDAEVQDDVLGVTRARLFRSGGLKLDRFVDNLGHTLTINQLRARDASAFRRVGL